MLDVYSSNPDGASPELVAAARNIMEHVARGLEDSDDEGVGRNGEGKVGDSGGTSSTCPLCCWLVAAMVLPVFHALRDVVC